VWPPRADILCDNGRLKTRRYYLLGTGKTYGVMLHQFAADDASDRFHDHPWTWGVSLMLRGGYFEERVERDGRRRTHWRAPWRLAFIRADRFHRVMLRDGRRAWTLFFHGPVFRVWRFFDAATGTIRPHNWI
jgi:hypothetical protein